MALTTAVWPKRGAEWTSRSELRASHGPLASGAAALRGSGASKGFVSKRSWVWALGRGLGLGLGGLRKPSLEAFSLWLWVKNLGTQNGTLVNGAKDQNLCSISWRLNLDPHPDFPLYILPFQIGPRGDRFPVGQTTGIAQGPPSPSGSRNPELL